MKRLSILAIALMVVGSFVLSFSRPAAELSTPLHSFPASRPLQQH